MHVLCARLLDSKHLRAKDCRFQRLEIAFTSEMTLELVCVERAGVYQVKKCRKGIGMKGPCLKRAWCLGGGGEVYYGRR